ncbi:MAG: Mov34/MPN/PAD-1 family protein [Candidatus Rokubacteria bacterium]|nr:Mov34/MPN/PAD-1 family protein [Candidatus Rokubacteria bacterium]MBI4256012.1 Mov34/MPN/PAD-1 family protein [Candidatus Rokubacteria bacterium]MBI4627109.1 Mov34/MPN/PAD-1 family protein [Candidatus Rokubacteria bacterium]
MILTAKELDAVRRQAVEEYPRESCGVVVTRGSVRRLLRCRNVQDQLHARDPLRHPRDARTAYYIDPQDLLLMGRLESEGFAVAVIYHSHVDAGAYFSPTDRQQAMLGGEPMYPKATYVVTSVVGGRVEAMAGFHWSAKADDFVPVDLSRPAPGWPERGAGLAGRAWAWLAQLVSKEKRHP